MVDVVAVRLYLRMCEPGNQPIDRSPRAWSVRVGSAATAAGMTCTSIRPDQDALSCTPSYAPAGRGARDRQDGGMARGLKMPRYIALVDGKPGAYGVVVPDLPGCTSGGKTSTLRCAMPSRPVRLWAEDARAEGETMPLRAPSEVIRRAVRLLQRLIEGAVLLWSRFCSMLAVPPRLISRSMPACWKRSTRPPRRMV